MTFVKKVTKNQLFLPLFSMVLVMLVNIIYDVANGNPAFNFFSISINNGILYGRLIDILNLSLIHISCKYNCRCPHRE